MKRKCSTRKGLGKWAVLDLNQRPPACRFGFPTQNTLNGPFGRGLRGSKRGLNPKGGKAEVEAEPQVGPHGRLFGRGMDAERK